MTRKLLMITTAIVALAAAPAAFAQGSGVAGNPAANVDASGRKMAPNSAQPAPAIQQQKAPGSSLTAGGPATLNRQPMTRELQSGKALTGEVAAGTVRTGEMTKTSEMKATGKMTHMSTGKHDRMVHRANASASHRGQAYRDMNGREVQMTRDLNRQVIDGQQVSMVPTAPMAPMQQGLTAPMQGGGTGSMGASGRTR